MKKNIVVALILFSFCGGNSEPVEAIKTLEDYENVWCVTRLADVNEILFLSEQIDEVDEKFTTEYSRDNAKRKHFEAYGSEEKFNKNLELTENYIATARISFTDYDSSDTRGKVLDTYKTLVKNEEVNQEIISFCKTWYKVNN